MSTTPFENVLEILNGSWAITPGMLDTIHQVFIAREAGQQTEWLKAHNEARESLDIDAPRARGYLVDDGVALIEVDGVLGRKMNVMQAMSGGASYDIVGATVAEALADSRVDAMVLNIHSPGGTVHGMDSLSKQIRAASGVKPIAAWTDGVMASAAYNIGIGAGSGVYIGSESTDVGSIGVVAKHIDTSKAEEKVGIKTTEITAGKYKRIASEHAPLTKEGRESMQEWVDAHYTAFVDNVAQMRGVPIDKVLDQMAEGRVFTGSKAIEAGLVDGKASLAEVMGKVRTEAGTRRSSKQRERIRAMDKAQLQAENAALFAEIHNEGLTAGLAQGIAEERSRIAAIHAEALPGQEELVAKCVEDGTSVAEAMKLMLADARAAHQKVADARMADKSEPLPNAGPKDPDQAGAKKASGNVIEQARGISAAAREYQAVQAKLGITVESADAVAHVMKQGA